MDEQSGPRRKGFVVTPVIFVGAALIISFMLYSHGYLDSRTVSAIGLESSLVKMRAAEMKNEIDMGDSLYHFSLAVSLNTTSCAEIESYVHSMMAAQGRSGTADVQPHSAQYFRSSYYEEYYYETAAAGMAKNITVTKLVPGSCS
jgi:hypothetical protein